MVSGVYLYSKVYLDRTGHYYDFEQGVEATELAYYQEGLGATVSVHRSWPKVGEELLSIKIDGKTVASSDPNDMRLQRTIGHLPLLLVPTAESALVIGLGAGVTAGACARHSEVDIEIVELEAAVLGAARVFEELNHHVVDDPRGEIFINDGRNHLLLADRLYDIVTVDPIHPFARGSASLYSREFFELCRRVLSDHGVMCQWLPLYELATDDLAMIMRTFQSVFPLTSVWLTGRDVGLIGSARTLEIEHAELARRMAEPAIRSDLEQISLVDPYALASRMVLAPDAIRRLTAGARLNTDDHLVLEYSAPRSMYAQRSIEDNLAWLMQHRTSLAAEREPGSEGNSGFRIGLSWGDC